jgi:CHAT domain-containing protein
MAILRDAAATMRFRTVEPRLSTGFLFRPLRRHTDPTRLLAAAIDLSIPASGHANGVLLLLAGKSGAAVETLERSLALNSGESRVAAIARSTDPDLLTDYAAACYERATNEIRPLDLAVAYEASARAIVLAPLRAEPWYVRALVTERLHLRADAIEAWKAYLRNDQQSGWAEEARQHLTQLERLSPNYQESLILNAARGGDRSVRQMVETAPRESRALAEEKLLGAWGNAILEGRTTDAITALTAAKTIGEALKSIGADQTVDMCVHSIEIAAIDGPPLRIEKLAAAHVAYAEARVAFAKARDDTSRKAMESAASLLERSGSPLAFRAQIYAATIASYQGNNDLAIARLEKTINGIGDRQSQYPVATGQAHWTRGLSEFALGLPFQALRSYQLAGHQLARSRERSNIAGVETVMVETYQYLGDAENAWTHQLRALEGLDIDGTYTRRQIALNEGAFAALDLGCPHLAQLFIQRLSRSAVAERDFIFLAQAAVTRARIQNALGRPKETLGAVDEATRILESNPATPSTARLWADVAMLRAEATMTQDPTTAIASLESAIARLQVLEHASRLTRIYLLLAQSELRRRDRTAAEHALAEGIRIFEQQRNHVSTDFQRSTFTDTGRALYDTMVQLLVERGATNDALLTARRARSMGVTMPGSAPAGIETTPAKLGSEAEIEYYILPKSLLIWITTMRGTKFFARNVDRQTLQSSIEAASDAIAEAASFNECRVEATRAYDLLVRPVSAELRLDQPVLIAPDGVLHRIPYAALFDSAAGKFFIEQHAVTVVLGGTPSREHKHYRSILVVASPVTEGFPALPNVENEARRAAALFPRALTLEKTTATPHRLLDEIDHFDIMHFAGHGEWNEREPQLAALRLTPANPVDDGALRVFELDGHSFRSASLVVLAACDTARGRVAGPGLLSFSRTFIARGIPFVIGSLWPIGDDSSAELFAPFYSEIRLDIEPAEAIRVAQRQMIAKKRAPQDWAAFQLFAGTGKGESPVSHLSIKIENQTPRRGRREV